MSRYFALAGSLFALLLVASPAAAANHFLLEVEGGLARPVGLDAESEIGSAFSGTFGFGGRVPGFAPAYYLIGRVGHSSYSFVGAKRVGSPNVAHGETEVAVGGRMYVPLTPRLRLLAQFALGETFGSTEISRDGALELTADTEFFTLFGALGAQFRVTNNFSLGAIADVAYTPDRADYTVVKRAAGLEEDGVGRLRMGVTGTFHF
ncbi:MAG: hypothetical protein ACI9U2_003400 [Bradymonadia bacterium]|jgi:hypothetical protein